MTNLVILGGEKNKGGATTQFQNIMGKCVREMLLRQFNATPLHALVNLNPFLCTLYHTRFCDILVRILIDKSLSDESCVHIFLYVFYTEVERSFVW